MTDSDEHQELIAKYKAKIKAEFGEKPEVPTEVTSKEYHQFKEELYPVHYSFYEKACNFSEKLLKIKADEKKAVAMQKDIDACHLNISPAGVVSFSIILPILIILFGGILGYFLGITVIGTLSAPNFFFVIFFLMIGLLLIIVLQKMPGFMANTWRMKASNQMVQSIFYMVTYMRHTSNIERAIKFAAEHLEPPLSLDFRKILWDVETQKFSTIRTSANAYLEIWKEWDKEFVEAFHLLESSLFESSEERRLVLLDKSLDVILNGTYENMLHYAHSLKSPMTMLHMLGIILPILGLVILPLVVSFLGSSNNPYITTIYIAVLYNISLPIGVYYLGRNILSKRPAGYGTEDLGQKTEMKKFRNITFPLGKKLAISINPLYFCITIFVVALFVGFSPLILHSLGSEDFSFDSKGNIKMLDYFCPPCGDESSPAGSCGPNCVEEAKVGPYGMGASLLSIILIAGLGSSIGLFYLLRSKNVIKIRERTKELENEFSSALFQLGNRLGDGLPAEIAFSKVAKTMQGTTSGDFFNLVEKNITKLGMGLEQAIFDHKIGALISYPSNVIKSSMKVLVESIKKGPRIAAQALLSMSRYIKEIHRVEERLKDLMEDVISSMKSQIKFLTPAIAGIVIGITSMISTILTRLTTQLNLLGASGSETGWTEVFSIFGIGIPTYHFQIVVGIYIIQIIFILTVLSNGIENGADKLGERFALGQNLVKSTLLYCFIAAAVMVLFNIFASTIMKGTLGV